MLDYLGVILICGDFLEIIIFILGHTLDTREVGALFVLILTVPLDLWCAPTTPWTCVHHVHPSPTPSPTHSISTNQLVALLTTGNPVGHIEYTVTVVDVLHMYR